MAPAQVDSCLFCGLRPAVQKQKRGGPVGELRVSGVKRGRTGLSLVLGLSFGVCEQR